jgi:hypothetical protein
VAALGGHPSGSIPGLMPAGSFAVLKAALQSLTVSPSSPFLVKVITGDNTLGSPKEVELRLKFDQSLRIVDIGGDDFLGLSLGTGPFSGTSPRGARFDHRHPASDSPIALGLYHLTVDASDLGSLIDIPKFQNFSRIYNAQVFWAPPGVTSPPFPQTLCEWTFFQDLNKTIGARAMLVGEDEVKVETGSRAFIHLQGPALDYSGSPSWTHVGSVNFPTQGELFVRVMGLR